MGRVTTSGKNPEIYLLTNNRNGVNDKDEKDLPSSWSRRLMRLSGRLNSMFMLGCTFVGPGVGNECDMQVKVGTFFFFENEKGFRVNYLFKNLNV